MDHAYLYRTLLERCRAALTEYQASRDFEALIASLEATMTEAEVQMEEEERYRDAMADDIQHSRLGKYLNPPEPIPTLEDLQIAQSDAFNTFNGLSMVNIAGMPASHRVALDMDKQKAWRSYWKAKAAYEKALDEAIDA